MKKKKTRKKVKVKRLLSLFLVVIIISALGYLYANKKITNIYVTGNSLLIEQTIIELAGLEDYPSIYKVSSNKIKKQLLISPFVESVKVNKSLLGKVTIEVKEYEVLCRNSINQISITDNNLNYSDKMGDGSIILSNGKNVTYDKDILGIPNLINQVDDQVYDEFIKSLTKIDKSILAKISEIEYSPNELDDERFLFYMTDQIYAYVTLSKIESINTYNEIAPTLEGKKGILYLDSGNHFQIKK